MKKENPFYYGGQAVLEGVMMRGRAVYALAVRKPDGQLAIETELIKQPAQKYPFLKWPLVRGVAAFVSSLVVGVSTLSKSADMAGLAEPEQDAPPSRVERFLTERFGDKLNDIIMQISVVLAILIAVTLFMLLPAWIGSLFAPLLQGRTGFIGVIEGLIRIAIFLLYVLLISLSKDIKRVFQYHGAEHKTINCYESGKPLTTANVMHHSRLHKRCGTSFLLVVMIISMLLFMFIRTDNIWIRFASRIVLLPVIAGLAYEISVKWAGRNDNWLVRAVIFPGLCLQRITTAEPDAAQIETAVAALEAVLSAEADIKTDTKTDINANADGTE